ncbi:MAG: leukotoxin LktA family filamentous adhesin [Gammaproteobacteria bacterium]|nr:leukotoxin LktA family filamentous adhesin [Gammaproteobacteria bacterium]
MFDRHPLSRFCIALATAHCLCGQSMLWAAQIVTDGRTQTRVARSGTTTDIQTATVRGNNAYNSFHHFGVNPGETVNLHLPNGSDNLLNLVRDSRTEINGVLNGIKQGKVGGNVFIANPHGVVVGAQGRVNVGSLSLSTPTPEFLDRVLGADGTPSPGATEALQRGEIPLNTDASIRIEGRIDAQREVHIQAHEVVIGGSVNVRTASAQGSVDTGGLVNSIGVTQGHTMVAQGGEIWILAEGDAAISGEIRADGAAGVAAGNVELRSGRDIRLEAGASVTARGAGEASDGGRVIVVAGRDTHFSEGAELDAGAGSSGDGGLVELSAKRSVRIDGGRLGAGAPDGKAGRILIDPTEVVWSGSGRDQYSHGAEIEVIADERIELDDVTLSSRQVAGGDSRSNHATAASTGDSGKITLRAKQIELKNGTRLLAQGGNGHAAGDVELIAEDDASVARFGSTEDQSARIDIDNATIRGGNILLSAIADDRYEYSGDSVGNRVSELFGNVSTPIDLTFSAAEAVVRLEGGARVDAAGELTIKTEATGYAGMFAFSVGAAFGWAEAEAKAYTDVLDATLTAAGDLTISSLAESTIEMNISAVNTGRTNPLPFSASKYIDVAVAVGKGLIDARANLGADASASSGGNAEISARGIKSNSVTANGRGYDDGTAAGAVAYSSFDSDINATLGGDLNAAAISIDSRLQTNNNSVNAASGVGTGILGSIMKRIDPRAWASDLAGAVSGFVSKPKFDARAANSADKLGLSASFLWLDQENDVNAGIANGGKANAVGGGLGINAYSVEELTYHSGSSVDQAKLAAPTPGGISSRAKQTALSAAVAVVDLENRTTAFIDDDAEADAAAAIEVSAKSEIPIPFQRWIDLANVDDAKEGAVLIFRNLTDSTLQLATGWTQAFAESEKLGIAGSFNFMDLHNGAKAWIGDGALINKSDADAVAPGHQDRVMTDANDVTVLAVAEQSTVNLSGIFGFNPKKAFTGTQSGANGFGGAYLDVDFSGGADASIGAGAKVLADDLAVVGYNRTLNVNIGESGGKAGKVGVNGVFSLVQSNTDTIAQIGAGSSVDADNLLVAALDDSKNYNIAGGIAQSANVGVGFSIGINEMTREVRAILGNGPDDLRADSHLQSGSGGTLTLGGNLLLEAQANGKFGAYSLAAALKGKPETSPGSGAATDTKGGKTGIGVSGDVSINTITETTEALADGGMSIDVGGSGDAEAALVTAGNDDELTRLVWTQSADDLRQFDLYLGGALRALNDSDTQVFGGAVSIGQGSFGLAGSFAKNSLAKLTHAESDDIIFEVNDLLRLGAENSGSLLAINASGSGSAQKEGIQIAGQYAKNDIHNEAFASIEGGSVTVRDGAAGSDEMLHLNATDRSRIHAIAGAVTLGGKSGIGFSISDNSVGNKTRAFVKDARVDAGDRLLIEALNDNEIKSLAAAFGLSQSLSISGAASANDIFNETLAYVDNDGAADKLVSAVDSSQILATDTADIETLAGGASLSKDASLGASVSVNRIGNTTKAYWIDATLAQLGNDTLIRARNDATIKSLAGGIGVAVGKESGGAGAAVAVNRIGNITQAYLSGAAADLALQNLSVEAVSDADIETISVALGGGGGIGIGGSGSFNHLNNETDAYINGDARVKAEHNVAVLAESDDRIQVAAGSAGIGVLAAGVGVSLGINSIGGHTRAYIEGSNTRVTGLAKGAARAVADGGLESSVELADQVDIATFSALDLKDHKSTVDITGVAVNASSTQHVASIGANVSGGKVAAGLVENISTIGGDTQAYALNARINQENGGAAANQQVDIRAGNIAYNNSFVGNIAAGSGAAGVGADLSSINRTTWSYAAGGRIDALDELSLNSLALQGLSSLAVGGSAGGIAIAGTLVMGLFQNETKAWINSTVVNTGDLTVNADSENDMHMVGGAISVGSTGGSGSFVVSRSNSTTKAYIENASGLNRVGASGAVEVTADNSTEIDHFVVSGALAGGAGIAGMASVNLITDTTEAELRNAEIGSGTAKAASLKLEATHAIEIDSNAGSLGVAISPGGVGVGAGASVNLLKARTLATIDGGKAFTSGATEVLASSNKRVKALAMTAGVGQTAGIGGAAVVTLIGDDVKDESAGEVDAGTLSAVDDFASNDRATAMESNSDTDAYLTDSERAEVNADSQSEVRDIARGTDVNAFQYRTAASVKSAGSRIDAGSIDIKAIDRVHANTTVGGFGISLGLGLGGGVGVTNVKGNLYAGADASADLDSTGAITVEAKAFDYAADERAVEMLALSGGAGIVGLGAAVALADVHNTISAELGGDIDAAGQSVSISAQDGSSIDIDAYGGSFGAGAVGAVIAHADKRSQLIARTLAGTTVDSGGLGISASVSGAVQSHALGAAGGILAGIGAEAVSTEAVLVQAYSGSGNTLTLEDDLSLSAGAQPQLLADAEGYGGSLAVNVGVAIAESLVSNGIFADLGSDNSVDADNLEINATQNRNGSEKTARAEAIAAGGSLVASVNATSSAARNTAVTQSRIGDNGTLTLRGDATLNATTDSDQSADVNGFQGALGAARGSNVANSEYNTRQAVSLGANLALSATRLTLSASGQDRNYAHSISGQGALLASRAAAKVDTFGSSDTQVSIGSGGSGRKIAVDTLDIDATHTATFNTEARTDNGALVGLSGAEVGNEMSATVAVVLGDDLQVEALDLTVDAANISSKPKLADANVISGSGGFYDGPAITSATTIDNTTRVEIGDDVHLNVIGDKASPGLFTIVARNDVDAYDEVELDSGGAIANAKGVSTIDNDTSIARVTIGEDALLESVGDIAIGTRSDANIRTRSYVDTYGLAGAGEGTTRSRINTDHDLTLLGGAVVRAGGDLILGAGRAAGVASNLTADAKTKLWNKTAVPFSTDPEAHGEITQNSLITIAANARALAIGDVHLQASDGAHTTIGDGTGTDAYREAAEGVTNFFGGIVGADEVSFDIEGGSTHDASLSGVSVEGEARAGIQHHQFLTIASDGSVAIDGDGNPIQSDGVSFTPLDNVSLNNELQTRIDALRALQADYADTPDISQAFKAEADFLEIKLADLGGATVNVDFLVIDDVFARSGDVHISGDYLQGSGLIEAPGDTHIRIWNQSERFLRLGELNIPEDEGGHVLFNTVPVSSGSEIVSKSFGGPGSAAAMTVIDATNSNPPLIEVLSTDVSADPLAGIFLDEDVSNRRGLVSVYSEGDLTSSAQIDAKSVELKAGRDVMLGFIYGFRHLGGDPTLHAPFSSHAATSESSYTSDRGVSNAPEGSPTEAGTLAGSNVFISAQRLNINNTIQSGRPYRKLVLDAAIGALIAGHIDDYDNGRVAADAERVALNFVPGSENSLAEDFVRAWWNYQQQRIELEPLRVEGGKIVLFGDIFSTGNGLLKAIDGFGRIDVDNLTGYALEVARADTGQGAEGVEARIQITDTAKKFGDKPITTLLTRVGNQIFNETSYLDNDNVKQMLASGLDANASANGDGEFRSTLYQPKENRRFHWVNGKRTVDTKVDTYDKVVPLDFGSLTDWLAADDDYVDTNFGTPVYTARITGDYLANENRPQDYYYDYTKTGGSWVFQREDKREYWSGLNKHYESKKHYRRTINEYYNHSIAADKPIDISFTGWDVGDLDIASQGPVYLTDLVRNNLGDTEISGTTGIFREGDKAVIEAKNLTLRALAAGIGGQAAADRVNVDLTGSVVNLYSMDDIFLHEQDGDLTIGEIVSSSGDVHLSADLGIRTVATPSGVHVSANEVILESTYGSIGNSALDPIVIDSNAAAGYTVTAEAGGDINLREQSGDLLADKIASRGGDINLFVPGGDIIDANGDETPDIAAQQALSEFFANEIGLLDAAAIERRKQATVAAYESSMEAAYESYWRDERNLSVDAHGDYQYDDYDPGVTFAYSADEAAALKLGGWDEAQIGAHEQQLTDKYRQFGQSPYIEGYSYQVTSEERADLTEGAAWSNGEITHALPRSLFLKTVSDTETRIEGANVAGRNVAIVAGGGIGSDRPDIVIMQGTKTSELSDQQRLALAAAEREDVSFGADRVTISQKEDLDVGLLPGGRLTLSANGRVLLGSEDDLSIQSLNGDAVRIKSGGGVYNADLAGSGATITAASAVLEASQGGLGSEASPLRLALGDSGRLTARGREAVVLRELSGDLLIDFIFSTDLIALSAPGRLLDANLDLLANLRGEAIRLEAQQIGLGATPDGSDYLDITHNPDTQVDASAADGIYLFSPEQTLTLGVIDSTSELKAVASQRGIGFRQDLNLGGDLLLQAAGDITLAAGQSLNAAGSSTLIAGGSLLLGGTLISGDYIDLRAGDQARLGSLQSGGSGVVSAGAGGISIADSFSATDDLRLDSVGDIGGIGDQIHLQGRNFTLNSSSGMVGSPAQSLVGDSDGKVNIAAATGIYYEERNGDLLADTIASTSGTVDLRVATEGATLQVDQVRVAEALRVAADNIRLPDVHNPGNGDLHVSITGNDGGTADSMQLQTSGGGETLFDTLKVANFTLDFGEGLVTLRGMEIKERGFVTSPFHRIVIDNVNRTLYEGMTAQLDSRNKPFDLLLYPERRFDTSALLINYDPHYIANAYSSENSVTRLLPKRVTLPQRSSQRLQREHTLLELMALWDKFWRQPSAAAAPLVQIENGEKWYDEAEQARQTHDIQIVQ